MDAQHGRRILLLLHAGGLRSRPNGGYSFPQQDSSPKPRSRREVVDGRRGPAVL
jgi:hypothetical protein